MEKRITGHTELLGLVATPIRHSKSPVMHNAACRALGLDYAYLAFDIQPDQLEDAVKGLKAMQAQFDVQACPSIPVPAGTVS